HLDRGRKGLGALKGGSVCAGEREQERKREKRLHGVSGRRVWVLIVARTSGSLVEVRAWVMPRRSTTTLSLSPARSVVIESWKSITSPAAGVVASFAIPSSCARRTVHHTATAPQATSSAAAAAMRGEKRRSRARGSA